MAGDKAKIMNLYIFKKTYLFCFRLWAFDFLQNFWVKNGLFFFLPLYLIEDFDS